MNDLPASIAEIVESTGLNKEIGTAVATKEPTKAALKLVERAAAIKDDPLGDPAYLARFLIQCTLPHTNPGNVPVWKRKNGNYILRIQPGWDDHNDCSMGYPYGTLPRLILIWITTEAKRTGIRRLQLGHSLTEFMHKLDLEASGHGQRSDAKRLKDQARRLFAANIATYQNLDIPGRNVEGEEIRKSEIVENNRMFWDKSPKDQAVLWGSWIDLSPSFFAAIMESVVPCDMRAIAMLRKSPLALDLYMLCNYIGATLKQRDKTKHFLTWRMLGQQLGCDYANLGNLKTNIKKAMRKVQLAHPGLRAGYPAKGGGLEIRVSSPAIAPRKLKVDVG
jgi:Plasmid encoded RepA protein